MIIKNENNSNSVDISLRMDGTQWCAMIGEMPETELYGFGNDKQEALFNLVVAMNGVERAGGKT